MKVEELFSKKCDEQSCKKCDEHWTEDSGFVFIVIVLCICVYIVLWAVTSIWFPLVVFPLLTGVLCVVFLVINIIPKMCNFFKSRNHFKF